ncbi:putative RNA-binding protein [Gordonia effusa NBRC 100432]|uniref:Putative RNA-binding protein n=1 Tax=Gordonia effusa NBRC 100432 TaxID=1077974 RepID=H0QY50_9ACTN|nr:DUF3558 family protein [Gordonia effusa]GAB17751.1 putative RNA-binding protein [Gordonia effusa NBRC 100432]
MGTRVDSWIWAIRLTKTRSAGGAACRAGHVCVNGVTAKPAHPVSVGDTVEVRLNGIIRIVEVTQLISKRVSAPLAAQAYLDKSPPPPPREIVASAPRRDRGAGRPTKRERRELEKFRGGLLTLLLVVVALFVAGCGSDDPDDPTTPTTKTQAKSGPFFGECGGVTLNEVTKETGFSGLTATVNNASVCEWASDDLRLGATTSFNWYRGSPIGREYATEKLSREVTKDITINGHSGFIAYDTLVCEVGIQFDDDFFEWSVSAGSLMMTSAPSTESLCAAAKNLSRMSIERATQ